MVAIFQFFIMANIHILSTLEKTADVNFLLVQFSEFSVGSVFPITHPRFHFHINAWLCLNHFCMVTFLHLANQNTNFPLIQFSKLSVGSVFPITHLRFCFNIYVWLHIKHSWWTFMHGNLSALVKSGQKIRQNRLTHLCVAVVNRLGNSNESPKISTTFSTIYKITQKYTLSFFSGISMFEYYCKTKSKIWHSFKN